VARRIELEYGDGTMEAALPDDAVVVDPGPHPNDPAPLADPLRATADALDAPLGIPPIGELIGPGSRVVIAFPDRVKGGTHDTAHRRVTIPLLLDRLAAAGVAEDDITLICAIGLHRKNTRDEMREYLGDAIVDRIPPERLVNHDPEDPDGIVSLGTTRHGDVVEVNRAVVEADLAIMIGHSAGNPSGGFSGGYKMPCTGLTTWRSIRCHHTPGTMYRDDFVPASSGSHFRHQLTHIGKTIEAAMKQPFFAVDAVLDSQSRQVAVAAGAVEDVERATWPVAARRTDRAIGGEPADVLVLGMPRAFHYGPGMGSNPILMLQAIGSSITRAAAALKPGAPVICASVCDGWFNDDWFPAMREVYDRWQRCAHPTEMERFEEEIATRPDYIAAFREGPAYHPFHGFSMLYMGGIALDRSRGIVIAGAEAPGYARGMGCEPVRSFEEAISRVSRHTGPDPRLLVIPALSKPQVHLRAGD
jgi:nickel-dependent lactate racemase